MAWSEWRSRRALGSAFQHPVWAAHFLSMAGSACITLGAHNHRCWLPVDQAT
jgi:hypothetical protein